MITKQSSREQRARRRKRIRAQIHGTPERLRLCVFRSSMHIYAQIIDDERGHTVAAASTLDKELTSMISGSETNAKVAKAAAVGSLLARRALAQGFSKVVFDRAGYLYHGRIKALADGARAGGLDF